MKCFLDANCDPAWDLEKSILSVKRLGAMLKFFMHMHHREVYTSDGVRGGAVEEACSPLPCI